MDLQLDGLRRSLEPPQRLLRGRFGSTQDDGIVRIADEGAEVACLLCPERVDGVAVDVGPPDSHRVPKMFVWRLGEDAHSSWAAGLTWVSKQALGPNFIVLGGPAHEPFTGRVPLSAVDP